MNMYHNKCGNNVDASITDLYRITVQIGISNDSNFKIIPISLSVRDGKDEEDLNFYCSRCGDIDKEELLVECDYCNVKLKSEDVFMAENHNIYCKGHLRNLEEHNISYTKFILPTKIVKG